VGWPFTAGGTGFILSGPVCLFRLIVTVGQRTLVFLVNHPCGSWNNLLY